MLLVKCSQCGASYKLSEDLYRRKAAGFGVVVTCRRCKTEIHVDADTPSPSEEDGAESDAAPTAPTHERPEPPLGAEDETPFPMAPEPAATKTPEPVAAKPAPKLPDPAAPLTAKPALLRAPGTPPRPAAATVKGLGVDAVKAAGLQNVTEARGASPPAPRVQHVGKTAPKLVALSPGLLGTVTAPKPKAPPSPPTPAAASPSPPAAASPSPPAAAPPPVAPGRPAVAKPAPKPTEAKAARDAEEASWDPSVPPPSPESSAADSEIPIASQDFLPADSAPVSEMSVDSKDFVTDTSGAEAEAEAKEPDAPKKRLPEAPPAKRGAKAEPKPEELPSTTGTPKLDTLIHGKALPLEQKKGEPRRKRLPSGDLSDDFMSADLGFDAPALSPPNADALMRAPVSSRPAASAPAASKSPSKPSDAKGTTKSARPVTVKAEKKAGSGRGWMALLLLVGLGAGGFAFRDRLRGGAAPTPEITPAASPPNSEPGAPEAPVAEPAPAPGEPAASAGEPMAEGPTTAAAAPTTDPAPAAPPDAPGAAATPRAPAAATPSPAAPTPASTAQAPSRPTAAGPNCSPWSGTPCWSR